MPYADPERQRAYQRDYQRHRHQSTPEARETHRVASRRWRAENPDKSRDQGTRRRERVRDYVRALKEDNRCTDCGRFYRYYVMDFDHVGTKTGRVSRFISQGWSIDRVQREIDECELVCANCHRERTFIRAQIVDESDTNLSASGGDTET